MTRRLSLSLSLAAILLVVAIILFRAPHQDNPTSWGNGFQWGDSKFERQ